MKIKHSYRLALVILTAVMLSSCGLGAAGIYLVAPPAAVATAVSATVVDDQAVVADQQK